MSTELEEMAEKAEALADKFVGRRTFDEARAALNEAGMLKARQRLHDALDNIVERQAMVREQQVVVQRLGDLLDQAIAAAEWELDARFVTEGAKTFLVDGDERRQMTADQRKDWKKLEALRQPEVSAAHKAHREAQFDLDACKDAAIVADKAFAAARADLDAAIATVGVLAASIKGDPR